MAESERIYQKKTNPDIKVSMCIEMHELLMPYASILQSTYHQLIEVVNGGGKEERFREFMKPKQISDISPSNSSGAQGAAADGGFWYEFPRHTSCHRIGNAYNL